MATSLRTMATLVWLVLSPLTVVSWALGTDHGLGSGHHSAASLVIITVAVFKVRLVGLYFKELRGAPLRLRGLFEGYCILFLGLLAVSFLSG